MTGEVFAAAVTGKVALGEPMSRHTTFRIGGPADIFFRPADEQDLIRGLKVARRLELPAFFIGAGSNLLVRDGGIRGLVINLSPLKQVVYNGPLVRAQAGMSLPALVARCCRRGLAGLEFAAGIPGTLAGGLWMNAGAHGSSLGELVEEVYLLDGDLSRKRMPGEELGFSYRSSYFQSHPGLLIMEAVLRLEPGENPDVLKQKVHSYRQERKAKQPLEPSAGSVFRNPPHLSAGKLIESVGGKGLESGAAQVSLKHGNFIVNRGGAKARDVIWLIQELQRRVLAQHGISLEPEIRIVGEDDNEG